MKSLLTTILSYSVYFALAFANDEGKYEKLTGAKHDDHGNISWLAEAENSGKIYNYTKKLSEKPLSYESLYLNGA